MQTGKNRDTNGTASDQDDRDYKGDSSEAVEAQAESQSRIKKVAAGTLRKTAKTAYVLSGLDLVVKNSRYMKPRNPRIWRELFSRDALKTGVEKFKHPPMKKAGKGAIVSTVLCIGVSSLIFLYSLLFIASQENPGALPLVNKIALVAFMLFGAFSALSYTAILVMKISRLARASKTTNKGANS